ncbi:MAG: hypothetical protein DSM106950_17690 [Stigonema ocellatum SAG 48.90 = DSM 106950]|nr:hypothetical protein [Stigonema ocellatum SAG 48.90 = DSM 106950]
MDKKELFANDSPVEIDNNMRQVLFGEDASTEWNRDRLFFIFTLLD